MDRDSLVCPECQGQLHYLNIKTILSKKIGLLAKLLPDKEYNNYSTQNYCPQCSKYIFYDSHHSE